MALSKRTLQQSYQLFVRAETTVSLCCSDNTVVGGGRDRQTDRQTEIKRQRQTDKRTKTHRERQRETKRETETKRERKRQRQRVTERDRDREFIRLF